MERHSGSMEVITPLYVSRMLNVPQEVARLRLSPSSGVMHCHVPMGLFHTCQSLESGSVIIEFKAGKYNPRTTEDIFEPTV